MCNATIAEVHKPAVKIGPINSLVSVEKAINGVPYVSLSVRRKLRFYAKATRQRIDDFPALKALVHALKADHFRISVEQQRKAYYGHEGADTAVTIGDLMSVLYRGGAGSSTWQAPSHRPNEIAVAPATLIRRGAACMTCTAAVSGSATGMVFMLGSLHNAVCAS